MSEVRSTRLQRVFLQLSTLAVAASGIAYELVIGTLGSYMHGDVTRHFAISFGVFTAGLGMGAWLSAMLSSKLRQSLHLSSWGMLAWVELALCIYGLALVRLCGALDMFSPWAEISFASAAGLGGVLVGLELPVLVAMLGDFGGTMALDYVGALLASWAFPFVLMPWVGLDGTARAAGLANGLVGIVCMYFASMRVLPRERSS